MNAEERREEKNPVIDPKILLSSEDPDDIQFSVALECTALDYMTIGAKVVKIKEFMRCLKALVKAHDWNLGSHLSHVDHELPMGQMTFILPQDANSTVVAGVGKRIDDPAAYILRSRHGRVETYLRRCCAAPVAGVGVIVYTSAEYLKYIEDLANMKQYNREMKLRERQRILQENSHYVLMGVAAFVDRVASYTPYQFVTKLVEEGKEFLGWSMDDIRHEAKEIKKNADEWSVVAD